MSVYLEGSWERSETPSVDGNDRFRLFCVASNAVDTLRVSNFNYAWRTDGSEIGRWTNFARETTPGRASAPIAGSLYSGALVYVVPNPPTITPGRVYPTPTLNPAGGWRYEPFNFGLPKTLALPAEMNAGYPSDVQIEISVRSTTPATTFMRATITSIVFDDRWNTLWLEEEIGDGWAREFDRVVNHQPVKTVGFATKYSALWRTDYFQPDGSKAPGIASYRFDASLSEGTYWLSALISAGLATTTEGYLYTSPANSPHYNVS